MGNLLNVHHITPIVSRKDLLILLSVKVIIWDHYQALINKTKINYNKPSFGVAFLIPKYKENHNIGD
ncbi:hypothetical protein Aerorivi_02412 [Aeromonas rivipollensis]